MIKNVMVAQSGGPTVAINASLLGVFEQAKKLGASRVYGACYGLNGLLERKIVNLSELFNEHNKNLLMQTPACFLGSCRKKIEPFVESNKLSGSVYSKILSVFEELNIDAFFYIGGNDSMDTVLNLSAFFKKNGVDKIKVVGVPKTIDNDLEHTDHCPGFGSAARFVATTFSELYCDCSVYNIPAVTIVEVMGRDAGWLTAASALSRLNGQNGPNLIYCCEQNFNLDSFLGDVSNELSKSSTGGILVAVSEGINLKRDNESFYHDDFGHGKNAGVAKVLEQLVLKRVGCKVRSIELSLLQRSAAHLASATDLNEALRVGMKAVDLASEGLSGVMVTIERLQNEPYLVDFGFVDVLKVANRVKKMPLTMLQGRFDISKEAFDYLKPLVLGEPKIELQNGLAIHLHM